jgi:tryptophan-rich sensory protein
LFLLPVACSLVTTCLFAALSLCFALLQQTLASKTKNFLHPFPMMFTLQFTALTIFLLISVCIVGWHNEKSGEVCFVLQILQILFMHSLVNVLDGQLQFFHVTSNNEDGQQVFMPHPGCPSSFSF